MPVKIAIAGCCGKMGSSIATLARPSINRPPIDIVGAIEAKHHASLGRDLGELLWGEPLGVTITDDAASALQHADVLIEFTTPESTMEHLRAALSLKKAMVIGTTSVIDADRQLITHASQTIPIVMSPNMSVGVNVLFELTQVAAERLAPSFKDVRIVEAHHQHKKDKPSGTAKRLQELIGHVRSTHHLSSDIPCESIREGEIVGDHTVIFSSPVERVELTHHANTRDVFAVGALKAAQFVVKQQPGLYDMSHVLRG